MTKLYWVRYNALETYGFYDQTLFHIQSLQVLGFHIYYEDKPTMILFISISETIQGIYRLIEFLSYVYNNTNLVIDIEYQHYDDKTTKLAYFHIFLVRCYHCQSNEMNSSHNQQ